MSRSVRSRTGQPRGAGRTARTLLAVCGAILVPLVACTPHLQPLHGVVPVNARLPVIELPAGTRKVVFTWEFEQESIVARGEGAARVAPPDSARFDLFLAGPGGGASAVLIGDTLRLQPGLGAFGEMVPTPPLIWAALGRVALPPLPDTIVRVSGDTTWADLGHPTRWRLMAVRDQVTRLDRVADGHVVESVERTPGKEIWYTSSDHRSLHLRLTSEQPATSDASIWHY